MILCKEFASALDTVLTMKMPSLEKNMNAPLAPSLFDSISEAYGRQYTTAGINNPVKSICRGYLQKVLT
jgi:hypothetical protein